MAILSNAALKMNFVLNSEIATFSAVRARVEPTLGETTHPGRLQWSKLHINIATTFFRASESELIG